MKEKKRKTLEDLEKQIWGKASRNGSQTTELSAKKPGKIKKIRSETPLELLATEIHSLNSNRNHNAPPLLLLLSKSHCYTGISKNCMLRPLAMTPMKLVTGHGHATPESPTPPHQACQQETEAATGPLQVHIRLSIVPKAHLTGQT